jgi:hypothetical protein
MSGTLATYKLQANKIIAVLCHFLKVPYSDAKEVCRFVHDDFAKQLDLNLRDMFLPAFQAIVNGPLNSEG